MNSTSIDVSRHIVCPHAHARLCETLERAALRHDWEAVFCALDAGADIDHLDGWLLRMAASAHRPDIVDQLIARGARRKVG